ncbi:MAG: hypothetical protein QOI91_63 [Solirubrobacteraceae bacterium]|nr:hypothetical protein [Solirubrobacteraceae bacterium]
MEASRDDRRVNLAGTIYGTVIATALVAGLSEDPDLSPGEIAVSMLSTMAAFWIAHAYAELLAGEGTDGRLPSLRAMRHALGREWALVQAAGPATLALLAGEVGLVSGHASEQIAIWLGLVALAGWGWVLARQNRLSVARALLVSLASGALGVVVVLVKLAVD